MSATICKHLHKTELVEKLAAAAEKYVEASLSGRALQQYRDAGDEDS